MYPPFFAGWAALENFYEFVDGTHDQIFSATHDICKMFVFFSATFLTSVTIVVWDAGTWATKNRKKQRQCHERLKVVQNIINLFLWCLSWGAIHLANASFFGMTNFWLISSNVDWLMKRCWLNNFEKHNFCGIVKKHVFSPSKLNNFCKKSLRTTPPPWFTWFASLPNSGKSDEKDWAQCFLKQTSMR